MKRLKGLSLFVDLEEFGYSEEGNNREASAIRVYQAFRSIFANRDHKTRVLVKEWDKGRKWPLSKRVLIEVYLR